MKTRANTFTLILLDDYSRYVVGHGVDDAERSDLVIKTFEEAVGRHGKPEMVLHDKGSAQYKKTPQKTRRWNLSLNNKTLIVKNSILPHENNPWHK